MVQAIPHAEYPTYSPSQLGDILKTKAILLTGLPVQADIFEGAMRSLNRFLDASIICNDQSIEMGPTGTERHRKTTIQEIIDISKSPNAKAVNCLDFPGPLPAEVPLALDDSLDRVCYSATWDMDRPRKTADMAALTWSIAATPSTWHHLHVDTNGFGTTAVPTFGKKLWALLRRKGDPSASRPIDWSDTLDGVNNKVLDSEEYEASYAILEPGTALVMPGGCPHMVFTLDDSTVFSGSHFYHGRCLRRHMFNLVITAALPDSTNTTHDECAISIIGNVLKMIRKACLKPEAIPDSMWNHLPNVRTEEGMKDALVLCVVARLLPVIFHRLHESKDELHAISDDALKFAKQIKASERHRFSTPARRDLDFFDDVYEVYLQRVLSVYV
ncbi:hypothetical protein BDN71DRAFT_1565065, partial [Pleurotus eryngii]